MPEIEDVTGAWEQTPWTVSFLGLDEYASVHVYKLFFLEGRLGSTAPIPLSNFIARF